ncbi:alkaline phosphatase family protein [Spirillospora sp. NPDC047279]|uniref:alkaline phosphatase family protein n=1 Tax=Spirillospora sp. NPDC047279 TaxID=3155478 RepID=UPI0033D99DC5
MAEIEHVVVLVLENRSFDHMLGFVEHPDPAFDGLHGGTFTNPGVEQGQTVTATANGRRVLPIDPDHSHEAMLEQLKGNAGFVRSYERKGLGKAPGAWGGLLGPIVNLMTRGRGRKGVAGYGPLVMRCQPPGNVPVLATLAREFGTCSRWFCSVPGETWPNRNFLHAATSDGDVDIQPRFYTNRTIFEVLEAAGKGWHVYFGDIPQVMVFVKLWSSPERLGNWYPMEAFARHVADGTLPAYSFIEPVHRPGPSSDSQHPGNDLAADHEDADDGEGDFVRAEALVARVYETLRGHPEVFERTILLVTYDENGGFYDHVPAAAGMANPGEGRSPAVRVLRWLIHRKSAAFGFATTGGRVPAVVISPYVPAGAVEAGTREHASVPATLRGLFAPGARPLTPRDAAAGRFDTLLTLDEPRRDLPDLSAWTSPPAPREAAPAGDLASAHYEPYVRLADQVAGMLGMDGTSTDRVREAFLDAAERAR